MGTVVPSLINLLTIEPFGDKIKQVLIAGNNFSVKEFIKIKSNIIYYSKQFLGL